MLCPCGSGRQADACIVHLAQTVLVVPSYFGESIRNDRWREVEKEGLGPLRGISDGIKQHELRFAGALPDFDNLPELFIASDYSGSATDKSAKYELFSFLIFPYHNARRWQTERLEVRKRFLTDRSMSFKNLNDGMRRRALPYFLSAANHIPGILIAAAVSKSNRSLFQRGGRLDMNAPDLQPYKHWKPDTFEKLLRVVYFLTFFLAGLSKEGQSFVWYSDDDDIAPNRKRLRELGEVWRNVITHVVPHRVPNVTIGTKKDDDPSRSLTDVLAVPDLACAAWCQLLARVPAWDFINGAPSVQEAFRAATPGALEILSWFATPSQELKRLLCIIDDPQPDHKVNYMCSMPPALDAFKKSVDAEIASRAVA